MLKTTFKKLGKSARKHSIAVTLNEVLRTQLLSMHQELANERSRSKTERKKLEESVCKLKTDINNEVTKCKRLEADKLLNNTVIMEMKEGLSKAELDNRCYLQQVHELNNRLASTEYNFKEGNNEVISLRTESEKIKKEYEILRREKESIKDLEEQLLLSQENNRALQTQLKETEKSLEIAEEENLRLSFLQKDNAEENSLENDRISKLQEELKSEKRRAQVFEDKLINATAQLEQFNTSLDARDRTFAIQGTMINFCSVQTSDLNKSFYCMEPVFRICPKECCTSLQATSLSSL